MIRFIAFLLSVVVFCSSIAFDATGSLLDTKGKGQKGIIVANKRTGATAKTDKKGIFILPGTEAGDTLVANVSKTSRLTFPALADAPINITLDKDGAWIDWGDNREKVAYAILAQPQRRKPGVITAEVIDQHNPQDLYEVLKIGIPGLIVRGDKVMVRGVNSMLSSIEPLFIIDGVQYMSSAEANRAVQIRMIETVELDREGGSYGMKGSNGVVIITYKGGKSEE